MGESLTQRHRVGEEGLRVVNLFGQEGSKTNWETRVGKLRASSRGNTEDPSIARNYWA